MQEPIADQVPKLNDDRESYFSMGHPYHPLQSSENMEEEGEGRMYEPKDGEICNQKVSCGHGIAITFMNLQQLCYLNKTCIRLGPPTVHHRWGRTTRPTSLRE